ncbi:CDP-alcohol phosphatidyltransferase family protein [Paenibacillus lutrae]|uniref:Phosphatidylglycerophosphate synthase n=1 Tax=Paenibacillus lutrae TaxID=2078573 RepID=A0A7X3K0R9_9BACL|nr:CDP-alcohol phosphatidyltransferase family protein [Paenibacillus lutrae]MVP01524.1 CDP-diacylglycerol--glycerol-3-phosphate 3-phosphatidyltransferase [Paenibacillus lutrae]
MNLPNLLTISRFFLIPVYLYIFYEGYTKMAFLIVVLAGITDIVDGYIARKRNLVTQLGIMLDPLADKLMMIAVIISLLSSGMIPWLAAVAFFIRDIGMIVGSAFFHFRGKNTLPANAMGKLTTVLYYLAVLLIIFRIPYATEYLIAVILFSFVTSIIYVVQFAAANPSKQELLREQSAPVKKGS